MAYLPRKMEEKPHITKSPILCIIPQRRWITKTCNNSVCWSVIIDSWPKLFSFNFSISDNQDCSKKDVAAQIDGSETNAHFGLPVLIAGSDRSPQNCPCRKTLVSFFLIHFRKTILLFRLLEATFSFFKRCVLSYVIVLQILS
jgi:hypothetical protein